MTDLGRTRAVNDRSGMSGRGPLTAIGRTAEFGQYQPIERSPDC
jgi:hypothetical protein